jgi:hypothetical protein
MLQQIRIKYVTALRQGTELRPEDLGAVRMILSMALEELKLNYRHDLADMDEIIADLLEQRDQLRAVAATDAGEILRLQTMEDRLTQWVSHHEPVTDTSDIACIVIDILEKYRRNGGTLVAPPTAINANGENGHGTIKITNLETRYIGRRLNISDEEVRTLALDKIRKLAADLGRTPAQSDWNNHIEPDEPSLTSVKSRLHMKWNQLIKAAGLEPNLNSHQIAAQKKEEARPDDAAAPFRGE